MQVARQLLSLSYWNLQDADAYVALMEIRRSLVLVVSQQPVPGTIGPENVGSWHRRAIVPIDLGTAEILATTNQKPPSSKLGANG